MDNHKLENRIKDSYKNIAPDILESVLEDCNMQKGQVIVMQEKKKNRHFVKYMAGMVAALALVVGGMSLYQANRAVASTIMLDVNPSIEIQVNKKEKVLDVKPLNEDAKVVVGEMDFDGSSLDVTINALIGSMLRNGYISKAANSILVSVDNDDPAAGQAMQTKLMSEINEILESGNVQGAVLGQTVSNDDEIQKLADKYGITTGKAKLIRQITKQNTFYTFEDLVSLSINELNLISESGGTKLENIESIGEASASSYIGEQAAKDAAFKHSGVDAAKAVHVKCELDWDDGMMVYEVDFDSEGFEYEYDINALTGDVVKSDKEKDDDYNHSNPSQPGGKPKDSPTGDTPSSSTESYIGETAAKSAAFKHAGVKESEVYDVSCEREHEHGITIYEVEFKANGYEYDYDINAVTGDVVKYSKEKDDDYEVPTKEHKQTSSESASDTSGNYIGAEAAKQAALDHSGVSQISDYECELELENGKAIYEISFKADGYEYDYEIDASNGDILKHEKEIDD
ncbi:MAG: PepSY domain-containing protein [Lachnospiraceae bacterium]|nr:PepSY domain-containing protein [Candidatus Minthocola equi]